MKRLLIPFALTLGLAVNAQGANSSDPDWPCIQGKVDELSIGQMWAGPVDETIELDADAQKFAETLALRKLTIEEVEALATGFADAHPDAAPNQWGAIYGATLARLNHDRARLISGISRYAHAQVDRVDRIEELRALMEDESAKETPDFDQIDGWEEELDWQERIYKDREQSLTYVCETPVLIEKRAFAIGRMLYENYGQVE